MRCLGPQAAICGADTHSIGHLLCSGIAHAGESRNARDPTSRSLQLNHRLHHRISFNFRPPEMVNPFR